MLARKFLPRYAADKINKHLSLEVFKEYLAPIILFEAILIIITCAQVYQDVEYVHTVEEHIQIPQ